MIERAVRTLKDSLISAVAGGVVVRLGRRFLGWEMTPVYAEIARKRMAVAREQLELRV